jgi:xanthine/CO dehydrogenase XdhC/CoxF family maturation factor
MLICEDGRAVGSLSGGCLEEEVALRARDVLKSGAPAIMSFDTRRRFGCHGKIDIFIERIPESFLVDLARHLDARRSCFVITDSERSSVAVGEAASFPFPDIATGKNPEIAGEADSFPYSRKTVFTRLVQQIHPPIRLLIFGEGPDSEPLRHLSELLGWQALQFADVTACAIKRDEWTAAIIKSHNYGRDFTALQELLPLNLRYVGLIGPRKRRDQLLNDLLDLGVAINAGFFAPAGLDLGAETPEEIALAVISEIQRVFAAGSGESLRERKISIHKGKRDTDSVRI